MTVLEHVSSGLRGVVPARLDHPVEESLPLGALLGACGGFLDAFTYVGYDHVFANAMSGNVVLTGIAVLTGQWRQVWWHLLPILAFLAGVCAAEVLRLPRVHAVVSRPAAACLGLEAAFLAVTPGVTGHVPSALTTAGISFVAAMQTTTFRAVRGVQYSSVMVTGNLRSIGTAAFGALLRREADQWSTAARLCAVCLAFLVGAALGAWATPTLGDSAVWIPTGLLVLGLLILLSRPLADIR